MGPEILIGIKLIANSSQVNSMVDKGCASCKFRKKYDTKPESLLGRLWRWHAGWCPGFKTYLLSLPEGERKEIAEKYGLSKYAGNV